MTLDLNRAMTEMYKKRAAALNQSKKAKLEDVLTENANYKPNTNFDQLYGCDDAREQLEQFINCFNEFVKFPSLLLKMDSPILISGSSGLGKTSIVEAASNYGHLKMIPFSLRDTAIKTRNDLQTSLEKFLTFCMANQPAVALLDDLDELNGKEERIDLIKHYIDRIVKSDTILLICTTSSLLNEHWHGIEFYPTIQLKRPDQDARFKILESFHKNYQVLNSLDKESLGMLALNTPSFTPSNLKMMFKLAQVKSNGAKVELEHCHTAIEMIKHSFKRGTHLVGEKPNVTWLDIGGMDEVRNEFNAIMEEVKTGDIDCQFAGIALYGPPGCGKTMVAKAMANEAGLNFISISPTELQNKFYGETEKNIRNVFHEAKEYEPCVIYFDEFEGLCGTRGTKDSMTNSIQTLLGEMDGFKSRGKSIILVSTNRLEDIDPAMKRPGRLSKHIYIGPPNKKGRRDILKVLMKRHKLIPAEDIDLDGWAERTDQFTGADLAFLVFEAKPKDCSKIINQGDLERAMKKIKKANKEIK